jgi:tripartite-type tricarboxylate transporter receptor subunit TctC
VKYRRPPCAKSDRPDKGAINAGCAKTNASRECAELFSLSSSPNSGRKRGLGVTSPQRWPSVPEFPAIAETLPGFEAVGFYGISAPKGTPPEIIEILNKAVGEALKDPKVIARLTDLGGLPMPMTPAEFGKLVADETEKWRKVVEFAGISVD